MKKTIVLTLLGNYIISVKHPKSFIYFFKISSHDRFNLTSNNSDSLRLLNYIFLYLI
jgi:hypothetical protein